jgi:tRNA uridine 5-carbamoylmethylation protein Kti12
MTAIILTGLPCSGKSTVSNILMTSFPQNWVLVSPDAFMESFRELVGNQTNYAAQVSYNVLYEDGWFKDAEKLAWDKHLEFVLDCGRYALLDDVNLSKKSRKDLKDRLKKKGITDVYNIFIDTSLETCKLRDRQRCETTGKCIPESEFERLFNLLETPSETEGFTKTWVVKDYDVTHLSGTLQDIVKHFRGGKEDA